MNSVKILAIDFEATEYLLNLLALEHANQSNKNEDTPMINDSITKEKLMKREEICARINNEMKMTY